MTLYLYVQGSLAIAAAEDLGREEDRGTRSEDRGIKGAVCRVIGLRL